MYAASWQSNLACQQNGLKIYCKLYIDHCSMIYYKDATAVSFLKKKTQYSYNVQNFKMIIFFWSLFNSLNKMLFCEFVWLNKKQKTTI